MNNNPNPLALIVEDDPDAAAIFSEALKAAQFKVEIIATGDRALDRLSVTEPDMVVLDMHLQTFLLVLTQVILQRQFGIKTQVPL